MGEGKEGMIWENGIETCIISCMKRVASPGSMHNTECVRVKEHSQTKGEFKKPQDETW